MAVQTTCTKCGKGYQLAEAMVGRRAKCKQCGEVFQVIAAAPARATTVARPAASGNRPAAVGNRPAASRPATTGSRPAAHRPPPPIPGVRPSRQPMQPGVIAAASAPAASVRHAPRQEPIDDGLPSLSDLRELEATGTPDAFSHLGPPTVQVERLPFESKKPFGTTIADADPVRAAIVAKEKEKMSRRALIAKGGSAIGIGAGGTVLIIIRIIGRSKRTYDRNQREREERR